MNKPLISIVMPSIRDKGWGAIYNSILSSFNKAFELIIVGPHSLPLELEHLKNIKIIRDFGSPVRCSDIGASLAEGKLITWTADDALFLPDALNKNVDLLQSMGDDIKNVVVSKYFEGKNGTNKSLQPDSYFKINGSTWTKSEFISSSYWLFNVGIMHRQWFETLGGWDCSFLATFYSHVDLAIRAQAAGSNVKMSDFSLLDCDHNQVDHKIIEKTQTYVDKPKYFEKYGKYDWIMKELFIDKDNWKEVEAVWDRFK